ncbi:Eco57I restriction-modification methylase domain-containing protein [Cetobacterium ceti]
MKFNDIYKEYEDSVEEFFSKKSPTSIKEKSQYFTPIKIVNKMLENIKIENKPYITILEPSCGCGILLIKLLQKILSLSSPMSINIDVFDIDSEALTIVKKLVNKIKLNAKNININLNINCENFLNINIINKKYDYIISNPPYKKIPMNLSPIELRKYLNGQPNLYTLFIAKSLELLGKNGKLILISPKNYLSGKYNKKLREYLFQNFSLTRLHTFNERNKIFGNEILQEICISHIENIKTDKVLLSYNGGCIFSTNIDSILIKDSFIVKTPRNKEEIKNTKKFSKFSLGIIGKEIFFKPGKVVQFRVKDKQNNLSIKSYSKLDSFVPLFIFRHIKNQQLYYGEILNKNISIKNIKNNENILNLNRNYIIIRKNVEKSYKKLISGIIYTPNQFNVDKIGLDNNLGYITNKDDSLSIEEIKGIYCVINSQQFDDYYRTLNSSHTINAYELENMYFPSLNQLKEIGQMCGNNDLTIDFCTNLMEKIL